MSSTQSQRSPLGDFLKGAVWSAKLGMNELM